MVDYNCMRQKLTDACDLDPRGHTVLGSIVQNNLPGLSLYLLISYNNKNPCDLDPGGHTFLDSEVKITAWCLLNDC